MKQIANFSIPAIQQFHLLLLTEGDSPTLNRRSTPCLDFPKPIIHYQVWKIPYLGYPDVIFFLAPMDTVVNIMSYA